MKTTIISLIALLLLTGAGCSPSPQGEPPAPQVTVVDVPNVDPGIGLYKDWNRIVLEEMIAFHIPPNCRTNDDPETVIIICPTKQDPAPTPAMHVTIRGGEIKMLRWENLEWEGWDDVIASIQILTPLTKEIQLTIQK